MVSNQELINQSELKRFRKEIIKIDTLIKDKQNKINDYNKQITECEKEKTSLEKLKDTTTKFNKVSILEKIKCVLPKRFDMICFVIISTIVLSLGAIIGTLFVPFGFVFVMIFGYIVYLCFKESYEKWKSFKSLNLQRLQININWKDAKICEMQKLVNLLTQEIEDLNREMGKVNNYYEQIYGISDIKSLSSGVLLDITMTDEHILDTGTDMTEIRKIR